MRTFLFVCWDLCCWMMKCCPLCFDAFGQTRGPRILLFNSALVLLLLSAAAKSSINASVPILLAAVATTAPAVCLTDKVVSLGHAHCFFLHTLSSLHYFSTKEADFCQPIEFSFLVSTSLFLFLIFTRILHLVVAPWSYGHDHSWLAK